MKSPFYLLSVLSLAVASVDAGLEKERDLLKSDPAAAVALLDDQLKRNPGDPWVIYNRAVAAYANKDYNKADELWQALAATQMPDVLREHVWTQIGNVAFRMVEPQIDKEPDTAVARLEQAREAFRVAIAFNKKNKTAERNLRLVEKKLEEIYARLAKQLAAEAKKENWVPKAVEKLQAALTYAEQAQALSPKDTQRQEEKKDIEKALAERLDQRAAMEEKTADQRNQDNQWERQDAEKHLQNALSDFQQAQSLHPEDNAAKDGQKRVEDKLANLFDQAGRKEQREGENLANNDPERAVDRFQQALNNFEDALAVQPEHADAKAGQEEVRKQLEQLHLDQGDQQAQRGEQQKQNDPAQAAENLLSALDNFEAAKALDPASQEIQPRIDKVQASLPELLTKLGQRQQQRGEKAEAQKRDGEALENFEKAEATFGKAQQMAPENEAAKEGQQQVQEALSRLRAQMAQKAEQQMARQPAKSNESKDSKESFQSMLAKLKDEQKDRDVNAQHHRGEKYNEDRDKNLRNW